MGSLSIKEKYEYIKETAVSILQDVVLRQIDNRYTVFNNLLNVYGVDEESSCVYLRPEQQKPLYCVSLATESNINKKLDIFQEIVHNHGFNEDAKIIVMYTKSKMLLDEEHEDFCTKQNVYLFTSLKEIAEDVAHFYDTDILKPKEIINALFDVGFINRYYNDTNNFDILSSFDIGDLKIDDMNYGFRTIFSEGVYHAISRDNDDLKSKYTLFQGIGSNSPFSGNKPHIKRFMTEDWRGYVAFIFDFNTKRLKGYINEVRAQTKNFEKNKEIREAYKWLKDEKLEGGGISDYCITNVVAFIDNPKVINRISSSLNISFLEKSLFRKNIIYGTPITQKDISCDGLGFVSDNKNYIQSLHKRHNIKTPKSRDVYGVDIVGNYISFSFSETGESPHWAIVAPTRSGKTFFIMKLISQSIGANIVPKTSEDIESERDNNDIVKPLEKIESCSRLGERRVVHFDTGYSALKFATELKRRYPEDVLMFKDDLNNLRFGLTDVRFDYENKQLNQEDIAFSLSIISLILEINGEEMLTAQEKGEIEEALTRVFIEDVYTGKELKKLMEFGGYEDVVARIKQTVEERGDAFDPYARTTELGLRGGELDFMQKPLLSDVLKELLNKANNTLTKTNDRIVCENAISKLKVITKNEIFSSYSKASIADSHYFYMELETIKGLGETVFLPIFMMIFQKLYRRDVIRAQEFKNMNKVPPKVYYIIEEAHNFVGGGIDGSGGYVSIRSLFNILLRESARYNIHLGFITQSPQDLVPELINNIGTRIVMPSNSINGDLLYKHYWKSQDRTEVDFYDNFSTKYYAFLNYGKGVITIKPPVSKYEENLFNSNPTEIRKALEDRENKNV